MYYYEDAKFVSVIAVDDLVAVYPDDLHLMLLDNSGTHHVDSVQLPSTKAFHFLPPYSPELNPIKRPWQRIKIPLAGRLPTCLGNLQEQMSTVIEALDDQAILSLIAPPWL
jgi:hypothetical protein